MIFFKQEDSQEYYGYEGSNWTCKMPELSIEGIEERTQQNDSMEDDNSYSNKRRKQNDEYKLIRFSQFESNQDRKQRIQCKVNEKKGRNDKKQLDRSTVLLEFSSKEDLQEQNLQSMSKEEVRKIKNRNSAQLSREKKKAQIQDIMVVNENLKDENQFNSHLIQELQKENHELKIKIFSIQNQASCSYCQNQLLPSFNIDISKSQNDHEQEFSRINNLTSRQLRTYGLLSLFTIIAIIGCMSTSQRLDGSPVSFIQIRNTSRFDQLNSTEISSVVDQLNVAEDSCFEISTADHLNQIKNFKLENNSSDGVMKFQINLDRLPSTIDKYEQYEQLHIPYNQRTFILNCSVSNEQCETLGKYFTNKDIHIENIHKQNYKNYQKVYDNYQIKNYKPGDQISILNIFEQNSLLTVGSVKCLVDQTSIISFDKDLFENLKI